ncbi:Zinc knuckle family protein, partial [Aphelenchoides avenae]
MAHHHPSVTASSPAQEPGTDTARNGSTAIFDNGVQSIRDRDPVPNATYADQLGATQATSQGAAATTATADVTRAAAGGKGPPGLPPDGPTNDSEEDKIAKSAFYRKSRFTRRIVPSGAKCEPLVMEKLPLRTFDGDVREYNEFRDDFINLIELQPHLSPQQKLQHLLAHLAGEPRAAAEGFELVPENYCVVLDLLEASYGDEGVIRNTLMRDFGYIPQPTEQPAELEKFVQNATTVTRRLKRCDIDVDDTDTFYSLLMGHLPVPIRLKLIQSYGCRGTKKVSCVLDGLRQYLSDIKEAEKYALSLRPTEPAEDPAVLRQHPPGHGEPGPPSTPCERPQQDTPPEADDVIITEPAETSASAVNNSCNDHLQERRTCPLCSLVHQAANCFMYPTIQKRLRRVLKLKICLLCLRGGHRAEVCPKRKKNTCKTCGHGQHHRIVCKDAYDGKTSKGLRPSRMRATTGSSRHPANSDPKRHFRTKNKSVTRNVTSLMTSATMRQ